MMTSYNAVPPPTLEEGKDEEEEERGGVSPESKREAVKEWESRQEKPAHVSADHWKVFDYDSTRSPLYINNTLTTNRVTTVFHMGAMRWIS